MYAKTTISRRNVAPLASSRRAILTPSDMSVNIIHKHTHTHTVGDLRQGVSE